MTRATVFFELHISRPQPGKIDGWVKTMEEQSVPFPVSKSMVVCGGFRGEPDQSVYVWIRRVESEELRDAQYRAVDQDDRRKAHVEPICQESHRHEDIVVTRLIATPRSPMQ